MLVLISCGSIVNLRDIIAKDTMTSWQFYSTYYHGYKYYSLRVNAWDLANLD